MVAERGCIFLARMAMSGELPTFSSFSFPKLNRDNYKSWKFNVDLYLQTQDLSEFTSDKEAVQPAKEGVPTAEEAKLKVKERKALAIICLSVEEDLKNILHEATSPLEAWTL